MPSTNHSLHDIAILCHVSKKKKRSNSPSSWLFFSLKRNKLCASSVKCCGLCTGSEWRVVYSFKQKEGLLESHWTLWANKSGCRFRGVVFFTDLFEALVGQNTGLEFHKFVHKEHIYIYMCFPLFSHIIHMFLRHPNGKTPTSLGWFFDIKMAQRLQDHLQEEDVQKLLKSRETSLVVFGCRPPARFKMSIPENLQQIALNPSMFGVPCHP